jgi:hypothetical protein
MSLEMTRGIVGYSTTGINPTEISTGNCSGQEHVEQMYFFYTKLDQQLELVAE